VAHTHLSHAHHIVDNYTAAAAAAAPIPSNTKQYDTSHSQLGWASAPRMRERCPYPAQPARTASLASSPASHSAVRRRTTRPEPSSAHYWHMYSMSSSSDTGPLILHRQNHCTKLLKDHQALERSPNTQPQKRDDRACPCRRPLRTVNRAGGESKVPQL